MDSFLHARGLQPTEFSSSLAPLHAPAWALGNAYKRTFSDNSEVTVAQGNTLGLMLAVGCKLLNQLTGPTIERQTHQCKFLSISQFILPAFDTIKYQMKLMKVDNLDTDLILGPRNILEPDPSRCHIVPIECIDIAIIPGVAFDEKGGRIGSGDGYYDRLIPKLSITTRKVALALESQIIPLVHMESHDKYVDIIITEKRIIYKI